MTKLDHPKFYLVNIGWDVNKGRALTDGAPSISMNTACIRPYISELLACSLMPSFALFTIFLRINCIWRSECQKTFNSNKCKVLRKRISAELCPTCLLRTARLLVCIGDWGRTPFDGGSPSKPQSRVWNNGRVKLLRAVVKRIQKTTYFSCLESERVRYTIHPSRNRV